MGHNDGCPAIKPPLHSCQPSYDAYWGQGRTYWRLTFPAELRGLPEGIVAANTVVTRVIAAIAPGIVVLDINNSTRHVDDSLRKPGEQLITYDETHLSPPVQVSLRGAWGTLPSTASPHTPFPRPYHLPRLFV